MRKVIYLLLTILTPLISYSQCYVIDDFNVIIWNKNRLLEWKDFVQVNVGFSEGETTTGCESGIVLGAREAESAIGMLAFPSSNKNIKLEIINVFVVQDSWAIGKPDKNLLEHEQIHFDISEYYTRLCRLYISRSESKDPMVLKSIYHLCLGMWINAQILYDIEVKHGNNVMNQNKWKKSINEKLNELDSLYKDHYSAEEINYINSVKFVY